MSIISGLNSLAYTGVEAITPPQFISNKNRSPTPNDYDNFNIGTIWLNRLTEQVYMLVSKNQGVSTWALFADDLGSITQLTAGDGNIAFPLAGNINIANGLNINTTAAIANTVTINLNNDVTISGSYTSTGGNLNLPNTTNVPAGVIQYGGQSFIHNYGTQNVFLGETAGNTTLTPGTAVANVGIGYRALIELISSGNNCAIGTLSGTLLQTGSVNGGGNVFLGSQSGAQLLSGHSNVLLGFRAGFDYSSSESSNIIIGRGNFGIAGESNVLRIGQGTGASVGQLNTANISGIYGRPYGATNAAVIIDDTGTLGTVVSSLRFKENVSNMADQSSALMKLRPVTFNLKSDESKTKQFGLIAEEVNEKLPAIVNYDEGGEPVSVRYHEMPAMLLNELQKLSLRVKALESELTEMRNR